ncbi:uncharacterized protein LOC118647499 [Monomorium pharaonis]|uniref:uncharacterized protein LOC118647499 n=1 Tax=Monomorium pharaonis TaxID=307658 RepID=UPI001745E48D|nr:uncharacterized protein LOC118647499 [Monomorium pharaonis]
MEVEVAPDIGIRDECIDLSGIKNNVENLKLKHDISSCAAKMISTLRTSSSITGAALKEVMTAIKIFVSNIFDFVQDEVTDFCTSQDIDVKSSAVETLLNKFKCNYLFKNMDTLPGQIEVLKKNYKYIQPREIPLGYRIDQRFNRCKQEWEQKQVYETMQYVSIIETLQLIMSHNDVREYINSETIYDHDWLINFRDGQSFQTHEYFRKYPNALRIQLYYDDIVINNPLGSRVQPHKIGAFYFVVQNLPQYFNSSLGAIHVLALCHTADIDKYGMAAVLRPFLQDMKVLESDNGVVTMFNGVEWTLRATLAAVCADGLAAHQLFGLLNPAALHFCRLCMINRNDFKNNTNLPAAARTKELHNNQVQNIMEKINLKDVENAMKQSGVKENSALHLLRYFHFTQNFVFDPMHDIFEDIAPMELKLVLNHFITHDEYNLKLDTFNNRIHLFKYGFPEQKNKPSANFSIASLSNLKDHKISQTAVQTWCLMRVFPFIVSDKVPEDDEYLRLIILNRIIEIVFSPKLKLSILPYLSELIIEHDNLFRKLFPDVNPINKHHHLSHYCDCIRNSGPLRWLHCLRFEAKHRLLKKYGAICCNYKNITKTMINICQILQCATWGTDKSLLKSNKFEYLKREYVKVAHALSRIELNKLELENDNYIFKLNRIIVHEIEYRNGFVAIDSGVETDNGDILFGRIKEIILNNDKVYLWCEIWQTLWLQESLNAYCVCESSVDYKLINTDDLPDSKPFSLWLDYKTNFCYIVLRHMIL